MSLTSGTRLGPYEIQSALGAGGMGEVYRARDTRLGRGVAVKVIPDMFAGDAERMARFQREAQLLAALNHPNIAGLYGLEEADGVRALVMELVEGETLAARIAQGPLPLEEALPIARQIADALECAHERGIVHRDLKPANVILLPNGSAKVLDFGLAKAMEPERGGSEILNSPTMTAAVATRAGVIAGTAAYMSPEQAKGKAVDRRSDVWSFGCVLYEMLTGRMAFAGETVTDTLAAVVRGEPEWSALPAATPPSVRRMLERTLRKDVRSRLQAIGDARVILEEAERGTEIEAAPAPAGAAVAAPRWRQVLPWAVAALACAAAVTAGFLARTPPPAAIHFQQVTDFPGVQAQPALSPDGRSVAFVSNRDGHYNVYVGLVTGGTLVEVTSGPNVKARPRWSPDGTTLAYARLNDSGTWDIWEVPALGGTPRRLILNAKDPAWSPDGRSLAYQDGPTRAIWLADAASGQNARSVTHLPQPSEWYCDAEPSFSPDGREIAYVLRSGGPSGIPEIVEVATGKQRQLTQWHAMALSPAWSPDGRYVYFSSSHAGTTNVWRMPASGGTAEQITTGQGDDAQIDVSADGKSIVFATFREHLDIGQLELGGKAAGEPPKVLIDDPARNEIDPQYSPDGRHIAYFSNLKGIEKEGIWVSNADGSNTVPLVRDELVNVLPQWMPDSEHVVYIAEAAASPEFRSVAISGGAPVTLTADAVDDLYGVGSRGRIVFLDDNADFQSFDPATKKMTKLGRCPEGERCREPRWSPDGNSLAYVVTPSRDDDPNEGVWVTDFHGAPRQVFRGWALWFAPGPNGQMYVLQGKGDLTGTVWRVDWDGKGAAPVAAIPLLYSYWININLEPHDFFDVAPDGRHLAFERDSVLQANIGMIEIGR